MNTKIIAIDCEVAQDVITNDDLSKILETSDEWIATRTGIKQRRIISGDVTSTILGINAAKKALNRAKNNGFNPDEIDLIIAASSAPDDIYPAVSCLIQGNLGLKKAACFDVKAACSGFIYSMNIARAFIKANLYKNILIVATDATTKFTDWEDRSTCVLFGDGAGAVILSATDEDDDIIGINLLADGSVADYITLKIQGTNCPLVEKIKTPYKPFIQMKGKDVYKFVMKNIPPKLEALLQETNTKIEDIDYFIPHQSNQRMIDALAQRMNISQEKVISNIADYGNMSAASIIVAIREAIDSRKLKLPAKVVLSAFGAGMTGANAILKLNTSI